MNDKADDSDLVDSIVEEYLQLKQDGQSPVIEDYCLQYPQLAGELRELLETVDLAEGVSDTHTSPDQRSEDTSAIPEQLGGYRIIREIGRGGMGVVYEARHEQLHRQAAVKVLSHRLAGNPKAVQRFEQEGRSIANLHHSNIVPLFEAGEDRGCLFLAMQLINGQSIDRAIDTLRSGKPYEHDASAARLIELHNDPNRSQEFFRYVAGMIMQIAEALQYAHRRGIIHRDIKPSNLILDENGVVWLTDFGLAKSEDTDLTHTGDAVGTLRFMPPERFRGCCDARSDIYSLGLTLYELLTQRRAFEFADNLDLLNQINNTYPAGLRTLDSSIPRDLETIVRKAIDKDPDARYQSAAKLASDLEAFLNDQPIDARRQSWLEQLVRWSRRNRSLAASFATILVLLTAGVIGAAMTAMQQSQLRYRSDQDKARAESAEKLATQTGAELRETLYFAEMNLAGQYLGGASAASQILEITNHWSPSNEGNDDNLVGWEWYFLNAYVSADVVNLDASTSHGPPLNAVWSPDDSKVAMSHMSGRVTVWDSVSGKLIKSLAGHSKPAWSLSWHPSKPNIIASCGDDHKIRVWNIEAEEPLHQFDAIADTVSRCVSWSPDGEQLAFSSGSSVFVWSFEKDEEPAELKGDVTELTTLQWSPDSTQLAGTCWWRKKTLVWDVFSGNVIVPAFEATLLKWTDDVSETGAYQIESWLLCELTGEIFLFDGLTKIRIERFTGHTNSAPFPVWGSGGSTFVSASGDRTARIWNVESGNEVRSFQCHIGDVFTARFSHDGKRVVSASADGTGKIWPVRLPQKTVIETSSDQADGNTGEPLIHHLEWKPDGTHIATASYDSCIRLWNTTTTERLARFEMASTTGFCWDPTGQQIAFASDGRIYVRDASANSAARQIADNQSKVHSLAWSRDGKNLVSTADDPKVKIWDLDGQLISEHELPSNYGSHAVWHPVENNVFAVSDATGLIRIWDNGKIRQQQLSGHTDRAFRIAWSPDGKRLVSGSGDGTVRIWDADSGEVIHVLQGHHNTVHGVSWSPLGNRVASCGRDGSVKIWDPDRGVVALTLRHNMQAIISVAWSPDGHKLAAGDANGTLVIWDASVAYQ